jgi:hypothetical protein
MLAAYAELASRAAAVALLSFLSLSEISAAALAFSVTRFREGCAPINGLGPCDELPFTVAAASGSISPGPPGAVPPASAEADKTAVPPGCAAAVALGTAADAATAPAAAAAAAVAAGRTVLAIAPELTPAPAVSLRSAPVPPAVVSAAAASVPALAFWFSVSGPAALEPETSIARVPSGDVVPPGASYRKNAKNDRFA